MENHAPIGQTPNSLAIILTCPRGFPRRAGTTLMDELKRRPRGRKGETPWHFIAHACSILCDSSSPVRRGRAKLSSLKSPICARSAAASSPVMSWRIGLLRKPKSTGVSAGAALCDQFGVNLHDRSIDVLDEVRSQVACQPLLWGSSVAAQFFRQRRNIVD